jgi:5-methyltetrahydropteroyltriglutamate--homocysteine methyltransferase
MQTYAYGFPRLGRNREFKKIIEDFWAKKITEKELIASLDEVERERLLVYKEYVDLFPLGEFTYYDNIFDNALIFGLYRFKDFDDYFEYARGKKSLELKKYFNTNYHYLVPVLGERVRFRLSWNKPLSYFNCFFPLGDNPVFLIGPYTFLKLSRLEKGRRLDRTFSQLAGHYQQLLTVLEKEGVTSVHIEEPAFCLDVPAKEVSLIVNNYKKIIPPSLKVNLITYYESVDFLGALYEVPFYSLGLDFVAGQDNMALIKKKGFPKEKKLICGLVDGRGPLRSNIIDKAKQLESIRRAAKLPRENILVANSCPLYHLPFTLDNEKRVDPALRNKISFAKERLYELQLIKGVLGGKTVQAKKWSRSSRSPQRKTETKLFNTLSLRSAQFAKRKKIQQGRLNFPLFPTTTIGSFPQDASLRKMRLGFKKGRISLNDYENYIREKIFKLVDFQESIDLDVLVHGEFERSDMVEFFAQKLKGFFTTDNGWIVSYGTRVYRPPIIHDRIERGRSLTLKEIFYASNLTPKPVKGIFTGPVTILAWGYNLRPVSLSDVAFELAAALNAEASELLKKGIKIIQIDEPAIKEFAPLKKRKWGFYFSWAIRAFNLTAMLPPEAQVHTHMCYSDFGEITRWILRMNFDVITIEAAREKAKIIDAFRKTRFNRSIGPGVWDIHSKYPAQKAVIKAILDKSIKAFGPGNVWVNPDCGLKTRNFDEVEVSLKRMVEVAKAYRKQHAKARRR